MGAPVIVAAAADEALCASEQEYSEMRALGAGLGKRQHQRRNQLGAFLAGFLFLAAAHISKKLHDANSVSAGGYGLRDDRNRLLYLYPFSDPKTSVLKPPVNEYAVDDERQPPPPFATLNHPSDVRWTSHYDPNLSGACDDVVLYLPDAFGGHDIGSQLSAYLVAALTATYLDRPLVLQGSQEFVGCPSDMLNPQGLENGAVELNEEAGEFPKSLMRLIEHPAWLSQSCPLPCQGSRQLPHKDWGKALEEDIKFPSPDGSAPEHSCLTYDTSGRKGRKTNVLVIDGRVAVHSRGRLKDRLVDRSSEESAARARDWALRLGASDGEASAFASLRDEDGILDYVGALVARSGLPRFQPWVSRDVEMRLRKADALPRDVGGGDFARGFVGGYFGIHVRRGQMLAGESQMFVNDYWSHRPDEVPTNYIPFKHYLEQLEDGECGTRHVYVSTDDPAGVHNEVNNLPRDMSGLAYLPENACIKFEFSFGEPLLPIDSSLFYKRNPACTEMYRSIVDGVADLTLLTRSDTFVGEYSTDWGRLVRMFRLRVNDARNAPADTIWGRLFPMFRHRANGVKHGPPVIEKDAKIAWGNTHAKHITLNDWNEVGGDGAGTNAVSDSTAVALTDLPDAVPASNLGNFFIDIDMFTEGISGWRVTLFQVVQVVNAIPGATLVEPCMMGGRLMSCTREYPPDLEGAPVPVSEVFDLAWAFESVGGQPPTMASYGDFLQHIGQAEKEVKHIHICLKASQNECPEPFIDRPGPKELDPSQNDDEITVYTMFMCWWGRCALELDRNFLRRYGKPRPENPPWLRAGIANLKINPRNIRFVREVLARAGIRDHFSLIHWRGEREDMDYVECAETIVTAKHNMLSKELSGDPDHSFLLMTSINEDRHKQWNGEKILGSNEAIKEALAILDGDGFIRFDDLLKNANFRVKDEGMNAVYDLVLAMSSKIFSTFANGPGVGPGLGLPPGCLPKQRSICKRCNYIGKFARLALDMRLETTGMPELSAMGCWPV